MTWKMKFLNFMTFRAWQTLLKGKCVWRSFCRICKPISQLEGLKSEMVATGYSLLISNCAFAGGPSPNELVPTQPYDPSSFRSTDPILKVVVGQLLHASPCKSFPLNCHLWAVVGGLPIVLQLKVAVSPSARVRFLGWSAGDWTTGRSDNKMNRRSKSQEILFWSANEEYCWFSLSPAIKNKNQNRWID